MLRWNVNWMSECMRHVIQFQFSSKICFSTSIHGIYCSVCFLSLNNQWAVWLKKKLKMERNDFQVKFSNEEANFGSKWFCVSWLLIFSVCMKQTRLIWCLRVHYEFYIDEFDYFDFLQVLHIQEFIANC